MNEVRWEGRILKAVVFDLDDTLIHTTVDFRKLRVWLFKELLSRGIPPSEIDVSDTVVNNVERASAFLRSQHRGDEEDDLRWTVGRLMDQAEMEKVSETRPVEGAKACIDALKAHGVKMGILTRGSRAYAIAALRYAGLDGRLNILICRDDHPEAEAKPNGVAMKRIAALLGTDPQECLLVGDHLIDLTCARSSSSPFVGVLTGSFKRQDWESKGCGSVIDSVADLPALLGIGKR
ncbi:MAG: HAD family hydrolase [Candidatus Saccharibacteria bacterium]